MLRRNPLSHLLLFSILLSSTLGCGEKNTVPSQKNNIPKLNPTLEQSVNTTQARVDSTTEHDWTVSQLRILQSLSLQSLSALPISVSNRYADKQNAAKLGKQLFFDPQFSANGKLSCASCHQPDKAFTDGLPRAQGINATGRNTPTIIGSAWQSWFYWDGRKDSLWAQALVPFEAADEMASSRLEVLRIVGSQPHYRQQYQALFGAFPEALLSSRFDLKAGPLGDAKTKDNWYRLPATLQQQINTAYANIGKSIAAYERTLVPKPSQFDRYVNSLSGTVTNSNTHNNTNNTNNNNTSKSPSLSEQAIAGAKLFIDQEKTQCLRCHNGPLLTNNEFHNINSGTFVGEQLDFGRIFGLNAVLIDEFNCIGPYSDAEPEQCLHLRFMSRDTHNLQGAFKTPSLRNLKPSSPYFHDGRFANLEEVINHYKVLPSIGGEIKPIQLSDQETQQLIAFLLSLSE